MNYLKHTLFTFALVISFALMASAQEREGEKKIPKPNPPVVIVNLDKKSDDKSNEKRREEEKRGNKPQTLLLE